MNYNFGVNRKLTPKFDKPQAGKSQIRVFIVYHYANIIMPGVEIKNILPGKEKPSSRL